METWKNMAHPFENWQVSSKGRVKRLVNGKWEIRVFLKNRRAYRGYRNITAIGVDGTKKVLLLHRMVAETFLIKPSDRHIWVNHKDSVIYNNCVDNLEWVTPSQNVAHGKRNPDYLLF